MQKSGCTYIIKKGARKGQVCNKGSRDFCATHKKPTLVKQNVLPRDIQGRLEQLNDLLMIVQAEDNNGVLDEKQNVHDTKVTKLVHDSINEMNSILKKEVEEEIKTSSLPGPIKENATEVFEFILTNSEILGYFVHTWRLCNNKDNKDILLTQVADCIDNGAIVCKVGIRNRILYAFRAITETKVADKEMIRKEILEKASILAQTAEGDELKKGIQEYCRTTYVVENILTQDEIDKELAQWIDHL